MPLRPVHERTATGGQTLLPAPRAATVKSTSRDGVSRRRVGLPRRRSLGLEVLLPVRCSRLSLALHQLISTMARRGTLR